MNLWILDIPVPVALAVVAALGYLAGRYRRSRRDETACGCQGEPRQAQSVADELERIALSIRAGSAQHQDRVRTFRDRVARLRDLRDRPGGDELHREAEDILEPAAALADQLASAYEAIRRESARLRESVEARTDALTAATNRRGLDKALRSQFALWSRYETEFSLATFDVDHLGQFNLERGHPRGDQLLTDLAWLIGEHARETDVIARYGDDEFVVVMPQVGMDGACTFSERLRAAAEDRLPLTISGGVVMALDGDTDESLLARADVALCRAKAAGGNCVFRHDGERVESVLEEVPAGLL